MFLAQAGDLNHLRLNLKSLINGNLEQLKIFKYVNMQFLRLH